MTPEQIENNFSYHPPKGDQQQRYEHLRAAAKELAQDIQAMCPDSREKALALTNLEQSVMWANASIARNEVETPVAVAISDAKKSYFAAIAITERGWGPIELADAEKFESGFFYCRHCSIDGHKVFHNVIGVHRHVSAGELLEMIASAPFEEPKQ